MNGRHLRRWGAFVITDWYFYAFAIPAVIIMGFSKGGFAGLSILSTPLLTLAVSPVRAAAIMLPILLVQDAVSVWAYRKTFDKKVLAYMMPGSCVGIFIGYLLAAKVSEVLVGAAVGLVAVGFVLMAVTKTLLGKAVAPATPEAPQAGPALIWGTGAGFTSFIAHAGGPMFQVFVLPLGLEQQMFAGTGTMFFAATNLIKVLPYLLLGQFSRENLATSAVLFPLAVVATLGGVWLVRRVSQQGFFRFVYGLTFVVGLSLIAEAFRG